MASYNYFTYEGIPCRIEADRGDHGKAEIYHSGVGLVDGPKMTILYHGIPITKSEFDAMIIAIGRERHDA